LPPIPTCYNLNSPMLDSSLVETLSRLTTPELERLHKFVHSPYFHEGAYTRDVTALWLYLRPHAPHFSDQSVSIQEAYNTIYPGKTFVNGKIEVLMSKLHQLVKQFAAQQATPLFYLPESLSLAAFFLDRGLPNRAEPLLKKLRETQQQRLVHDAGFWAETFLTEWQTHRLDSIRQNNHDHESLAASALALQQGYLVLMLQLVNTLLFNGRKSKVNLNDVQAIVEALPAALQTVSIQSEPVLQLLYRGFELVRAPQDHGQETLHQLLEDLEIHAEKLPENVLRALHGYLRNRCTWQFNHGDTTYAPLLLSLYKTGLERGLLFENGQIQAATLLNMVQTGLVCRAFPWVKTTLERCRDHLVGVPNPTEFYHYNLANYHYHLLEYDRALELLRDSSDNLFSTLMARKLELKIYYETDSVLLDSKMDNFKLFVFRQGKKKLAENVFLMNNAFIDFLRQLTAANLQGNPTKAAKLREKIQNTPLVAERMWLLEQIERLGKRKSA
jgi:hypothetical protein